VLGRGTQTLSRRLTREPHNPRYTSYFSVYNLDRGSNGKPGMGTHIDREDIPGFIKSGTLRSLWIYTGTLLVLGWGGAGHCVPVSRQLQEAIVGSLLLLLVAGVVAVCRTCT